MKGKKVLHAIILTDHALPEQFIQMVFPTRLSSYFWDLLKLKRHLKLEKML